MRAFGKLALVSGATLFVSGLECTRHIELMILQDASTSFYELGEDMANKVETLIESLNTQIGTVEASLAVWSDKPVPFRGAGFTRGVPDHREIDRCYVNDATFAMSSDPAHLKLGYEQVENAQAEGGDYPENPYEAMIYAALDPKVNWTKTGVDENGNAIVKIMLIVTDDFPHYYGEANDGINSWNPDGEAWTFWGEDFAMYGALYRGNEDNYARLIELKKKQDTDGSLATDEQDEFDRLLDLLGPAEWATLPDHPGTFEASEACQNYEYPKLSQVGEVLNKENILPILIVSGQSMVDSFKCADRGLPVPDNSEDWVDCLMQVFDADFKDAGIEKYLIAKYSDTADTLIQAIVDSVDTLTQEISCPTTTSTAAPTVTSTESETSPATERTETPATKSTELPTQTSDAPTKTTEAPTKTSVAPTQTSDGPTQTTNAPSTKTSESDGTDDYTTSETTSGPVIIPVPPVTPSHGVSPATIAGATGGAVAGVAAIAGVLYKKFGASLFKNSSDSPAVTEQVEVPDTPVEREALEEVTMEMFQ